MKTIAIVDYGMGNLRSVTQAVEHVAKNKDTTVVWAKTPEQVMAAQKVVLPGQGAMRDCMAELHASGMKEAVLHAIKNKPLLGICIGMQMLLDFSEEQDTPGLAALPGTVKKFQLKDKLQIDGRRYKIPQIGWNQVFWPTDDHPLNHHPVTQGIPSGSYFYFVHSFYARPSDMRQVAAQTTYGHLFCSAIAKENVFATQFHPEKSAHYGLKLFENFIDWQP